LKDDVLRKLNTFNGASCEVTESEQIRARGLGRLLCYALLDAEELGCESATEAIAVAIDSLRSTFGLTDSDLIRCDPTFMD
jgi:hypothetical protein